MNDKSVRGQIAKILTTADQSVRIYVDIPHEMVPDDLISWLYAPVEVARRDVFDNLQMPPTDPGRQ